MSAETMEWLNRNTLIGLTDKRGNAWHYRADLQSEQGNHYPGFIPVGEVEKRLFDFHQTSAPLAALIVDDPTPDDPTMRTFDDVRDDDGKVTGRVAYRVIRDPDRIAVVDDAGTILGVHSAGYAVHDYKGWLLDNVATIVGDDLGISSAGLLRNRRQAWVEVSMPENRQVEGVEYRPNLLAYTSHDASLSTTYKRTVGMVVCDNTLAARIGEAGETVRIKHTSGSLNRIGDVQEALAIVRDAGDVFEQQLKELLAKSVSYMEWEQILNGIFPYPVDDNGKVVTEGRGFTRMENKRIAVDEMARTDIRCAPWWGTAWGVVQTFNTWQAHKATVKGGNRVERNQVKVLDGTSAAFDVQVSEVMDKVLAGAAA